MALTTIAHDELAQRCRSHARRVDEQYSRFPAPRRSRAKNPHTTSGFRQPCLVSQGHMPTAPEHKAQILWLIITTD